MSVERRGQGVAIPVGRERVGLPTRPFLYTLDQIATLIHVAEAQVKASYVYFEGRSTGTRRKDLMVARNIAPDGEKVEWRVAERELVRWLKVKGFRYYEMGVVSN